MPAKIVRKQARPDVCETYPGRAGCPRVGFKGEVDFSRVTKGEHTLSVRFTNDHEQSVERSRRTVVVE